MTESMKTAAFLTAGLALVVAAAVTRPENRMPSLLNDEGQPFYPEFRDAQAVKAIEVVDYDEPTATARPLKVEFRKSRWLVASNHDYPIDVGDRLAKTAAALIDLHKDRVVSGLVQDQSKYGVIDPLDQKASLQGRGKRVTLRDGQKNVLADFILGKPVEGKAGWRYVRVPDGKRTYAVKTDADPSARFADWVNAGLLRMPSANIRKITLNSYSVDTERGTVDQGESVALTQENGQWKSPAGAVKEDSVKGLAAALDSLKIVDARPKPNEMARDLRDGQLQLSMATALSLRQFGFLLTQNGRVMATDGEMTVEMANGVAYTIRFGDVAAGTTDAAKSAGADRYLFVTTSFDPARAARYGDTSAAGERTSRELNSRFADWFYVIGNGDFQKLRLGKKDVVK